MTIEIAMQAIAEAGGPLPRPARGKRSRKDRDPWNISQDDYTSWQMTTQGGHAALYDAMGAEDMRGYLLDRVWIPAQCGDLPLAVAILQFDCALHTGAPSAIRVARRATQYLIGQGGGKKVGDIQATPLEDHELRLLTAKPSVLDFIECARLDWMSEIAGRDAAIRLQPWFHHLDVVHAAAEVFMHLDAVHAAAVQWCDLKRVA